MAWHETEPADGSAKLTSATTTIGRAARLPSTSLRLKPEDGHGEREVVYVSQTTRISPSLFTRIENRKGKVATGERRSPSINQQQAVGRTCL